MWIWLMKDGQQGQYFLDNDAVIAAVKKWIISADLYFYKCCINAHVKNIGFISENSLIQ